MKKHTVSKKTAAGGPAGKEGSHSGPRESAARMIGVRTAVVASLTGSALCLASGTASGAAGPRQVGRRDHGLCLCLRSNLACARCGRGPALARPRRIPLGAQGLTLTPTRVAPRLCSPSRTRTLLCIRPRRRCSALRLRRTARAPRWPSRSSFSPRQSRGGAWYCVCVCVCACVCACVCVCVCVCVRVFSVKARGSFMLVCMPGHHPQPGAGLERGALAQPSAASRLAEVVGFWV